VELRRSVLVGCDDRRANPGNQVVSIRREKEEMSSGKKDNDVLNVIVALALAGVVIGLLYYFNVLGS
jgi:hypothetical protein